MITLEQLKHDGLVLSTLESVECSEFVTAKEFAKLSLDERTKFKGIVVCESPIWFATDGGRDAYSSDKVFSSDGNFVYVWNRADFSFSTMIQRGDYLQAIKRTNYKEETEMADLSNIQLPNNLDEVMDAALKTAPMEQVQSFAKPDTDVDPIKAARDAEREQKKKMVADARERLGNMAGCYSAPQRAIDVNKNFGRVMAYITGSNSVVKLAVQQVTKYDKDNKPIPKPDTPEDIIKECSTVVDGKTRPLPIQYREKEKVFKFRSAKPGAIKGVLVGTPVGTEIPLRYIGTAREEDMPFDADKTDLVYKVLDIDTFTDWVSFLYGNKIKESAETITGATEVSMKFTATKDKNGIAKTKTALTFASKRDQQGARKQIIQEGNYIPLRVYKTVSTQSSKPEDIAALNLNVEAAVKHGTTDFTAEALDCITGSIEKGNIAGKWFTGQKEIGDVPSYDGCGNVARIVLPVYEKGTNKNGAAVYKIKYADMKDTEAGPLSLESTKRILGATGMSSEALLAQLSTVFSKKSSGNRIGANELSAADYLRGRKNNFALVTNGNAVDFNEMSTMLEKLSELAGK